MKSSKKYWSERRILEDAKKYSSISDWKENAKKYSSISDWKEKEIHEKIEKRNEIIDKLLN